MKGRSSTKQGVSKGEMEVDKEGAHLSGAYIRSLVKQLTSSRTTKDPNLAVEGDGFPSGRYQNFCDGSKEGMAVLPQQPPPPPQQPKKQVRRRLHTTRPYQERLLNMAEARREIVTALKFHRASMKQQSIEQQQPPPPPQQQLQPPPPPPQEGKATKCRRNPRIYPSNNSNSDFYSNYCSFPNNNYSWLSSQIPPPLPDNFDLSLPNQPLGLNLNFQDFNNLDATMYHNSSNPSSIYSSSSISPSSSSSFSNPSTSSTSSIAINQEEVPIGSPGGGLGLHHAIDDEEMEEIRWIGEQHEMEWNDTMNLVTSAWWFKFLKTSEIGEEERQKDDGDACYPFEEVMEFPAWLNANESCMQQHCFSEPLDDLMEDTALPCMDIGEIEGMDGEWWT